MNGTDGVPAEQGGRRVHAAIPASAAQHPAAAPATRPWPRTASTARLLAAGVAAGPIFLIVYAVQAVTRPGFDSDRHPLSLLALGGGGWVQIANFVVAGALFVACAAGLKRTLTDGPGATWIPRLAGAIGSGLIIAGVFVTDPGAGFPAGAPAGTPEMSWHGALHELGFVVVQVSGSRFASCCAAALRPFAAAARPGRAWRQPPLRS